MRHIRRQIGQISYLIVILLYACYDYTEVPILQNQYVPGCNRQDYLYDDKQYKFALKNDNPSDI
jgi:hypothetical protein